MAHEAQLVFGTVQQVGAYDADITDGNFNAALDVTEFDNTTDTAVPYAPLAEATFYGAEWLAAPGDTIDLYMIKHEVAGETTEDDSAAPLTTDAESAEYVGSFPLYDTNEAQRKTITISLAGVIKADFYIMNNSGTTLEGASTTSTLDIVPFSYRPVA